MSKRLKLDNGNLPDETFQPRELPFTDGCRNPGLPNYIDYIDPPPLLDTQKLGPYEWVVAGVSATRSVVDKTAADLDAEAAIKLNSLLSEVVTSANAKVDSVIDPNEKPHWMGMADKYARQEILWVTEITKAHVEQRAANEVLFPPLTEEEHLAWFSLSNIQGSTCAIREAAMLIIAALLAMTTAEMLALGTDWVETNVLWP